MIMCRGAPPVALVSPMKVEFIVVMRALRRTTLAGQLLTLQFAIVVAVLVIVAALSVSESSATFNRVEGRRVSALAEQLAATSLVRARLAEPGVRGDLATLVHSVSTQSGVQDVTIADVEGSVRASTNAALLDSDLPLGSPAVAEGKSWSGTLAIDGTRELVAQIPVLSDERDRVGRLLGTVMVGEVSPSVWQRLRGASSNLLIYLSIASILGGLGSWLLARRIKRQTLGLEPHEITGLAEHREALLYGIAEGVIALDPQHRITLVNDMARRLLDLPEHAVGVSLSDLRIGGRLYEVLVGATESGVDEPRAEATSRGGERDAERDGERDPEPGAEPRDEVVIRRGRVLVMNRMHVTKDGRYLGTVTTLRDRTELAQLERQLGSFRSSTQLLRAQAHEFANQLHIISGLIQIGDHDEVVRYVDALSAHRASLDVTTNSKVRDPAVAALLMAKSSLAAERRVELRIADDTHLERLESTDSADVATIVGNLLDNAVDAAVHGSEEDHWVEVALHQDASTLEVVVRDSGPGVAPELAQEVFAHGFTTKAAASGERGIGLALTRLICRRRGGEVSVSTTESGAMFTATLTVAPVPETAAS